MRKQKIVQKRTKSLKQGSNYSYGGATQNLKVTLHLKVRSYKSKVTTFLNSHLKILLMWNLKTAKDNVFQSIFHSTLNFIKLVHYMENISAAESLNISFNILGMPC